MKMKMKRAALCLAGAVRSNRNIGRPLVGVCARRVTETPTFGSGGAPFAVAERVCSCAFWSSAQTNNNQNGRAGLQMGPQSQPPSSCSFPERAKVLHSTQLH